MEGFHGGQQVSDRLRDRDERHRVSMRDNPPGWYRDPDRPKWHRYWNGESWDDPLAAALQAERPRDDREQPA